MPSLDDVFDPNRAALLKGILNTKENLLKKKNSEIENRLFKKTNYYVIAVGVRPATSDEGDEAAKVRAYVYHNGYIYFYNTHGKAQNERIYVEYIDFVKQAVDSKKYQWTDFWINKGQIIMRDRHNNIHVDTETVQPFGLKSGLVGNVSEVSLELFYEFLRTVNKDDEQKLAALEESYSKGVLQDKVEKMVKSLQNKQLADKDGEIIVRTRIEGYNYLIAYVKHILSSNRQNKYEIINAFFTRVFFLEMYGYIGNESEE